MQIIHEREYITPTPAYFHEWAYPGRVSGDGRTCERAIVREARHHTRRRADAAHRLFVSHLRASAARLAKG